MTRTHRPHAVARFAAKALGAAALALAIGSTTGCMVRAQGRMATSGYVAYEAPPPPRQEAYEQRSGHVWVKGRWAWQNGQWQWVPGHWERERAGYAYQEGRWEQRNNQWHWIEGTWVVSGSGHVHGQDHYGPDREQHRDHRDGQPGSYQNPGYVQPQGHVHVPPPQPGGLTASNGAGTVVAGAGGVVIYGPNTAPPPRRVEQPGPSRSGHVWIAGRWQWTNGQYEWVPGHWERERAGHQWYDGEWRNQNGTWVWIQGEWRASAQTPAVHTRDRRTH